MPVNLITSCFCSIKRWDTNDLFQKIIHDTLQSVGIKVRDLPELPKPEKTETVTTQN